jgi:hypothetical protein
MAVVLGIAAAVGYSTARAKATQVPAMPTTVESLEETKEWMNDRMSSKTR